MQQETVSTSVTLDKDLHRRMKAMLAIEGMTINGYIVSLIEEDMAKRDKVVAHMTAKIRQIEQGIVTMSFSGKVPDALKAMFKEHKWIRWERKSSENSMKIYWNLVLDLRDESDVNRYSYKKVDFLYAALGKHNIHIVNYDTGKETWRDCSKSYFMYLLRASLAEKSV